jgi:hypothetical protein
MIAPELSDRIDAVLEGIRTREDITPDHAEELLKLMQEPGGLNYLSKSRAELEAMIVDSNLGLKRVMAQLAAASMLTYAPAEEQPTPNVRFARKGPAGEIALAGVHLLQYPFNVPLDIGDGPLEEADDPDFTDYSRVYASAARNIAAAGFYLLDPIDSRPAILSSPPEQETFPPLPFARVWVELSHLTPLLRLVGARRPHLERPHLDLLGIAIVEVEQGNVWDIYLPFQFADSDEPFFLAGRIAPDRTVSLDPALGYGDFTFAVIRNLAVGIVHLITARNAPAEHVALPRPQRRRLERAGQGGISTKLYYVDLNAAGEHDATETGREYHYRWLVRGHWRHIDSGRSFCTCCDPPQIASWVTPYIKGPPGMPWKGKQVHRA